MLDPNERGLSREIHGAIEALSDGVAIFDADDALVMCNAQFRGMYARLDHLLKRGLPWGIFLDQASKSGLGKGLSALDLHLESGVENELTLEVPRPGDRWMRLRLSPTSEAGFVVTQSDISEAHQAAELRAEADGLLRQVLDACAANLMMSRISDGEILYRNPASAALFGKRQSAREVFEDPARRPDMMAELLAVGAIDDFEVNLLRADGNIFPGRVSARLVEFAGEEVIVSNATDMTQLYAQRDELARQREASFQNEKLTALGELLAGVAHELNNPLSVVVGQSLMLRDELEEHPNDEMARRVDKIRSSAERCSKIVKTFLAMARQQPIRPAPILLNEIAETAADVVREGLRSSNVTLTLELAPDLAQVQADETQIAQVVINLLVNAEQAMQDQQTAREITLRSGLAPDGAMQTLEVIDTGPGIPAAVRGRVFEPFFTTKSGGAGVGLALCHRIVTAHAGRLEVDCPNGGGTRFTLALPLAASGAATGAARAQALSARHTALLVEDEGDVAEILEEMLDGLGIETRTVPSAEIAIAALESGLRPDVILSDVKMPGLGGEGFYRALRKDWPGLAKRLAFVTGDAMGRIAELGRPVLEKPVAPQELRSILSTLLDKEPRDDR